MLKVGLTGSIAVGKSFVLSVLGGLGCLVLDADQIAREVVRRGTPGLQSVIDRFGSGILLPDGELDRARLATIVFADQEKMHLLNSIIHPLVFEALDRWLSDSEIMDSNGIAVVDAALMIESGGYKRFNKLIVVWCEPAIQLTRLMLRENLDRETAERRIAAQMPQEEKKAYADFLIDTSPGFPAARQQTNEVFEKLLLLR